MDAPLLAVALQANTGASSLAVTITSVVVALSSLLAAVVPMYFRRRASTQANVRASWEGLTEAIQRERDRLQTRLDESENRCHEQLVVLEQEWQGKLQMANGRVKSLEDEVGRLNNTIDRIIRRDPL